MKDKKRIDWMESQHNPRAYRKDGTWGFIAGDGTVLITGCGKTLRAAIDDAMSKEKPPGEAPWPEVEQLGGKHWPRPDHGQKLIEEELRAASSPNKIGDQFRGQSAP